jgi:hypothetical protein
MDRLELVAAPGEVGRGLSDPAQLKGASKVSGEAIGQTAELPPHLSPDISASKSTTLARIARRKAERVTIERAGAILGLAIRTVQRMSQRGELPGAALIGRRWTYNEDKLRAYVRNKEREIWQAQRHRQDVTGVRTFSGAAPRSKAAKSDGPFVQAIQNCGTTPGSEERPRGS